MSALDMTLCSSAGLRLFALGWILTAITNFPAAYTHTSLNTAVHKMNDYLNESFTERYRPLEHSEASLIKSGINSVWYVGQVVGALVSPAVCDQWGRKAAYIISVVLMTVACALQTFASLTPYPEILILGRVITSIFSPLSDAALMLYLQEVSPASLRGTMSSLYSTGYSVMCLLGMFIGHEQVLGHSLPLLMFVPVIPGILATIFMCFVPETPKFLIGSRKDKEGALRSLRYFQGAEADETQLLGDLATDPTTNGQDASSFTDFLREPHLLRAFSLSVAVLVLTLPFYPILQSSTFFFTELDIPKSTAQLSSFLLMVLLTFCCVASTTVVDNIPRRVLLLTGGTSCIFSLGVFVIAAQFRLQYLAMGAIFGFVFSYGFGVGPVAWFICPELVPLPYRSIMFCSCYAVHSCLVVVTNFATVPLFTAVGGVCFLPIYLVPCCISLVFIYIYLPETKGRETADIVTELKREKKIIV